MEKRVFKKAYLRGFCFGVENAVEMLEGAIRQEKGTVYVRKEIVHNIVLTDHYKALGVVFVDEIDEIPTGSVVLFSAHGVAPSVREKAKAQSLTVIDTTCPLVTEVHKEAVRFKKQGCSIILIGEAGHKEVIGVIGEAPDNIQVVQNEEDIDKLTGIDNSHVAWLSQTTLNVDDTQKVVDRLREKYPLLQDPKYDICKATRDRQNAVKSIANERDLFIVVGSKNSSNTNRLAEVASEAGAIKVVRVDMPEELDCIDFSSVCTIGITSGVSVKSDLFDKFIMYLEKIGYIDEEKLISEE